MVLNRESLMYRLAKLRQQIVCFLKDAVSIIHRNESGLAPPRQLHYFYCNHKCSIFVIPREFVELI